MNSIDNYDKRVKRDISFLIKFYKSFVKAVQTLYMILLNQSNTCE